MVLVRDGHCLVDQFVESFNLTLRSWMARRDAFVFGTGFLGELFECVRVEGWSVIALDYLQNSMGREDFFSFCLVVSKDVVVVNSTSGYLEYWSVATNAYFPLGNGPQKSTSIVVHGRAGSSVILAGSVCVVLDAIWQSKHVCTDCSICKFMPGHQYL